MRLCIIIIILNLFFFKIQSQVCHGKKILLTENGTKPESNLELVFDDNFDDTTLDLNKWNYTQPWGNHSGEGFNASLEYQTDGLNYEFTDGKLKLLLKKEKIYAKALHDQDSTYLLKDNLPNLRWWDYTAGMIYSKQEFGYGKYELRCKIPKGKSFWSVFWLYGADNDEIDVFEFWNEENIFGKYKEKKLSTVGHMTTHANGKMCESDYTGEDYSTDFHTFTLIRNNYKIEWFVDGELKRTSYKFYDLLGKPVDYNGLLKEQIYIIDKTFPVNANLNISVSLGIQPNKNKPDASTPFPSSLEIDYIRFWRFY